MLRQRATVLAQVRHRAGAGSLSHGRGHALRGMRVDGPAATTVLRRVRVVRDAQPGRLEPLETFLLALSGEPAPARFFSASCALRAAGRLRRMPRPMMGCPGQRVSFTVMGRRYASQSAQSADDGDLGVVQGERGNASAELKSTPIKTLLNRLYLLVHPDLFADYPREQEVNGKSLQSLMAFLDSMKKPTHESPTHTATMDAAYSVSFYLLPSADELEQREREAAALPRSSLAEKEKAPHIIPLKRVSIVLQTSLSYSKKGKEDTLRHQLSALFYKCGIMTDDEGLDFAGFIPGDGEDEGGEQQRSTGIPSIQEVQDFLSKYGGMAMKKQEDLRMVERDVGMHKYLLMTMQRGLRVTFGRQEMDDPRRQLELLKSLLNVVEDLHRQGKELHNCTVCFSAGVSAPIGRNEAGQSKSMHVYDDVFGRIFLNSLDSPGVWYKVLNAVDMDLVHDRQRYLKLMKRKEVNLADKFGFKLFCADYSSVDVEEYVQFLDRITAETEECIDQQERRTGISQTGSNRQFIWAENERLHKNISIIVKGHKKLEKGKVSVDPAVGLLSISLGTHARELLQWIQNEGEKVAHQNAFISELRERETQLRVLTKRRLRLLDLMQDETITREDMTEFCFTLRKYANDLAPLMQRLSIIGSDRFGINDYGDLRLPWNFN